MSDLPILDAYILAMLDRGCASLYDLQHAGGLSLGASIPALKRLKKAGMVTKGKDRSKGKRVKFDFRLTASGQRAAQYGWKAWLSGEPPLEIDGVLRLIDLALHYKLPPKQIKAFAMRAAAVRLNRGMHLGAQAVQLGGKTYPSLRAECERDRLAAEASALERIATRLTAAKKRKDPDVNAGGPTLLDVMK